MNFFRAQEKARSNTRLMVILLIMAITSLVILTNVLILGFLAYLAPDAVHHTSNYGQQVSLTFLTDKFLHQVTWERCLLISLAVILLIALGSLLKIFALRAGGRVVAEALGGELIDANTKDYHQRRLLNVVEEMAIASGMPIPPVYLLPERGINAFAAGFKSSDAVIGVTQGTISRLSRDELQGVVAHEFSHIFNGDMRLNIKLIGLLNGILIIALVGRFIFRAALHSRRSSNGKKSNPLPLLFLGFGLLIVGYGGLFFGRWIKAAVSRQREYLADASAIQYTRDTTGISNALKKIGGLDVGSSIDNPSAEEASHLFFSSALSSLFATHPPLAERIRKIEPRWNGEYLASEVTPPPTEKKQKNENNSDIKSFGQNTELLLGILTQSILTGVGQPNQAHLNYALTIIQSLSTEVTEAVHEPYGARAVIYALLLSDQEDVHNKQMTHLEQSADKAVFSLTQKLTPEIQTLAIEYRFPLVTMALPALKSLSSSQYATFRANLDALIHMDGLLNVFEWSLKSLLHQQLSAVFQPKANRHEGIHTYFKPLLTEISLVLSFLCHAGNKADENAEEAFLHAADYLMLSDLTYVDRAKVCFDAIDDAIAKLNWLVPEKKKELLLAFCECIHHDGKIITEEAEVIRTLALILECPLPPLIAEQPVKD